LSLARLHRVLFVLFIVGLGSSITLSQSALVALAVLSVWRLRDPEWRRRATWPLALPVLAFAAATVLSALAAGHAGTSLLASKGLLLAAALYVTVDALASTTDAERFLTLLSAVAAAAAALGLLQVGVCPGPGPDASSPAWLYHRCARARGPYSIDMTLAGILTLTVLATLPRLLPGGRRPAWFPPVWFVMLVGLLATYTRGAWLGLGGGVLALVALLRRGRWVALAGLVVLVLVFLAGPRELRQRFLSMGDPAEATVKERLYMWRSGMTMWRAHPWLGLGPGGVKREFGEFALPDAVKKRTGHLHSNPLQVAVERGLVGLAAWLWLWVAFYAAAARALRALPADETAGRAVVVGSIAAITGFLVGGISEYNFGDSEVVMVAWAVMALPFVVARDHAPCAVDGSPAARA
jgi:O-antigen ligase